MASVLKVDGLGDKNSPEKSSERKGYHIGWLITLAVILLCLLILNSPLFSLKTFEVEGNSRVSDEEIMEDLELSYGTNLFRYALSHFNADPDVDPRLMSVDVYFEWPSTVRVVVEEGETIGYVYFQGMYLCIDQKGQVASSTSEPDEDLPIITGLNIGSFTIGETLDPDDSDKYTAVMTIGSNLRKYNLQTVVNEINVRNMDDIILYTDHFVIHCGDMTDIDQKINIIEQIVNTEGVPDGVIHMEDLSKQVYLVADEDSQESSDSSSSE